jgi:hypothetical protein
MTRRPLNTRLNCAFPTSSILALGAVAVLMACGTKDDSSLTGNVLPSTDSGSSEDSSASEAESGPGETSASGESGESGDTGNPPMGVPATYRFGCIDIQQAGSADDASIQANLLQDNWANDIANHRLNIMVDFLTLDDASGDASMMIRSGIGTSNDNLCSEPNSDSATLPVTFDPAETLWGFDDEAGKCAKPAGSGASSFGTFNLQTGPEDVIYIYAEDDDGQSFNCTSNDSPDAVPIHAVDATFTMSDDESVAWGSLTGCLVEAEAEQLCSCLGTCVPPEEPDPNCDCNPDAIPLRDLLLGVTATDNCTEIMGEPAFDMTLAFVADRLPNIPVACE